MILPAVITKRKSKAIENKIEHKKIRINAIEDIKNKEVNLQDLQEDDNIENMNFQRECMQSNETQNTSSAIPHNENIK